jgi:hypothetical protein
MMDDESRVELERQVEIGNHIKAVLNSKGWKEAVIPIYMAERDKVINSMVMATDPNFILRSTWIVGGMDMFINLLNGYYNIGEQARGILREDK